MQDAADLAELDRLMVDFFDTVSFDAGAAPRYDRLYALFIDRGVLVRCAPGQMQELTVAEFVQSRWEVFHTGKLSRFEERELTHDTVQFGHVAQRWSRYAKAGTLEGAHFHGRGMISTQFVRRAEGWRISAMAWDDERAGLALP
jgi:hypothetical protein